MNSWGVRGTLAAMGVAAVVGGVGGVAVYAATDQPSGMPGPGHWPPPPQQHAGEPRQVGAAAAVDPAPLHGESVVADGKDGFATQLTQTGTLTAVSPTSVTVASADGYRHDYVLPKGSATPPFHVGDAVVIRATREGEAAVVQTMRPPLASDGN